MRKFRIILLLVFLFMALSLSTEHAFATNRITSALRQDPASPLCPIISNTPFFTITYGSVLLNGVSAPVGTVVKAFSPRNDLVGCFAVTSGGTYGTMYLFGEDTSISPAIPGMRTNEPVTFTIDNIPATATPELLWKNDKDLHLTNLASQGISADFHATPLSGAAPLAVQFTDTSSGSITSWSWSFGDGQSSVERNPQHTYAAAGVYSVSLTILGPSGSDTETKSNYITVGTAPSANFSVDSTSGIAPLTVSFTNTATGDYSSTNWSFGDGGESTAPNPTHTYDHGGVYTVSLTVSGSFGSDTETKASYITVYNPVAADFSFSSQSGNAPLTVAFTNTSSGDFSSSSWNFGDGGTSTQTHPAHTFLAPGTYSVSLTVTGDGGQDTELKSNFLVYTPVFIPVILR